MLDNIPVRAWLLIVIAAAAFAPVRYLVTHVVWQDASDITQPPDAVGERRPRLFALNLAFVAALMALAIFIYTPTATQFAHSPSFWPILMGGIGIWSLFTVIKGLAGGKIELIAQGFCKTYERLSQPKRFWGSLIWNTALGVMCFWAGFGMIGQASFDLCYDRSDNHAPKDEISACNALILDRAKDAPDMADILAARGTAYHRNGDIDRAMIDYTSALRLDSTLSATYYNRGLIYEARNDPKRATVEYRAAIREDPDNADARQRLADLEKLGTQPTRLPSSWSVTGPGGMIGTAVILTGCKPVLSVAERA